ncbi:MAG: hypothetical protein MUD14_22440 [Hydrococcus sp. Prado102]|jgi:hypothetical protein|nr:hypothetical protein [Hydrococcus sp. Prado102]
MYWWRVFIIIISKIIIAEEHLKRIPVLERLWNAIEIGIKSLFQWLSQINIKQFVITFITIVILISSILAFLLMAFINFPFDTMTLNSFINKIGVLGVFIILFTPITLIVFLPFFISPKEELKKIVLFALFVICLPWLMLFFSSVDETFGLVYQEISNQFNNIFLVLGLGSANKIDLAEFMSLYGFLLSFCGCLIGVIIFFVMYSPIWFARKVSQILLKVKKEYIVMLALMIELTSSLPNNSQHKNNG